MTLAACLHLPVSLSYPEFAGMSVALDLIKRDVDALMRAGFESVLIENDNDKPHTLVVNEAQTAWLTRAALATRALCPHVGIGIQRIDWRSTLAVAAAAELQYVRLDVYVDTVKMLDTRVEVDPKQVLAWRKQLQADAVELWVDVHVKHAELLSTHSLEESVTRAHAGEAAAVLITSDRTGTPPSHEDLRSARNKGVAVLIGSGLTVDNARTLKPLCDGAVVGTALKEGDRISYAKAKAVVDAWRSA